MGFRERFRELRIGRGMSQAGMDDYFGLMPGTARKWENGWDKPEEELLEDIAGYFRVKVHELTDEV